MKLVEMTSAEVKGAAAEAVALLPLASIEQHGPHLAVSTDAAQVVAVAEEVERRKPGEIVLCPALCYGSSHHHLAFAGTVSLSPDLYTRVVMDLVRSLVQGGFRRILLLNGHGGNIVPAQQALSILGGEWTGKPLPNVTLTSYWELAGEAFAGAAPMESPRLSHACEYETSLMLHLFPDRVRRDRIPPSAERAASLRGSPSRPGVHRLSRTQYATGDGACGRPDLASAEKGKVLWEKAVAAVADFVTEFRRWPFLEDLRK